MVPYLEAHLKSESCRDAQKKRVQLLCVIPKRNQNFPDIFKYNGQMKYLLVVGHDIISRYSDYQNKQIIIAGGAGGQSYLWLEFQQIKNYFSYRQQK